MNGEIRMRDICMSYGEKKVLQDFSAIFPMEEVSVIMGPSGCGKTTLLRTLTGLETPLSGSVEAVPAFPAPVSLVFQEDRLLEMRSARENVTAVLGRKVPAAQVDQMLFKLGLGESIARRAGTLSGGMKRRVSIARALLFPHALLVMDEPFRGLDKDTREKVAATLLEHEKNRTIIFTTHDPAEAILLNASCVIHMEQL